MRRLERLHRLRELLLLLLPHIRRRSSAQVCNDLQRIHAAVVAVITTVSCLARAHNVAVDPRGVPSALRKTAF